VSYSLRFASGGLLVCTLGTEHKQKSFPLVPRSGSEDLVLWVSKYHDAEYVETAQRHFEEIERDMQRTYPSKELRLCFD